MLPLITSICRRVPKTPKSIIDLTNLCSLYSEIQLFLWLQYKFAGNVVEQQAALALVGQTIDLINQGLKDADKLSTKHNYISRDIRLRKVWKKNQDKRSRSDMADDFDNKDKEPLEVDVAA